MTVSTTFNLEGMKHEQEVLRTAVGHFHTRRRELMRDWADEVVTTCATGDVPTVELRRREIFELLKITHIAGNGLGGLIYAKNRALLLTSLTGELNGLLEESWLKNPRTCGYLPWILVVHGDPDQDILLVTIRAEAKHR